MPRLRLAWNGPLGAAEEARHARHNRRAHVGAVPGLAKGASVLEYTKPSVCTIFPMEV